MKLSEAIVLSDGLGYLAEGLKLSSAASHTVLLNREMICSGELLEACHRRTKIFCGRDCSRLCALLGGLKNISLTLERLAAGMVLSDVELFEIKNLAINTKSVAAELSFTDLFALPDLHEVASALDPDHTGVASFYIYDSYSPSLARLRKEYNRNGDAEVLQRAMDEEAEVCKALSKKLQPHAAALQTALQTLFDLDIAQAQAQQLVDEQAVLPEIVEGHTAFEELVSPVVRNVLRGGGAEFQPIDIMLTERPTVIIGSNMGGKSVTLRSLVTAQLAFQFNFGVTAAKAEMEVMDDVKIVADTTDTTTFSSFAAEMTAIDSALRMVLDGRRVLVAIDEPARTTNPTEGTAIVEALLDVCRSKSARVVAATHYNIEDVDCRRLKVNGMADGRMDYRLTETAIGVVPNEALRVAEELDVDARWIENTKKRIDKNAK